MPDDADFAAFARVKAWAKAIADNEVPSLFPNPKPSRVSAILAEAWNPAEHSPARSYSGPELVESTFSAIAAFSL